MWPVLNDFQIFLGIKILSIHDNNAKTETINQGIDKNKVPSNDVSFSLLNKGSKLEIIQQNRKRLNKKIKKIDPQLKNVESLISWK